MSFVLLMIVAGAIYRLVPHPMNAAPVAALAFVGGMCLGKRYALWVPLAILAVSDLVLNAQMHYPLLYWPRVIDYIVFAAVGWLGVWLRKARRRRRDTVLLFPAEQFRRVAVRAESGKRILSEDRCGPH